MTKLAAPLEKAISEALCANGYLRSMRGQYVRSANSLVWSGLWITFYRKGQRLYVQPCICFFCPAASKILSDGQEQKYGRAARNRTKMGNPFDVSLLYDQVRKILHQDRMPYSYGIESVDDIDSATKLISDDFFKVAPKYFGSTSSVQDLRDRIVAHPSGAVAGIHAMALTYLADKNVSARSIDDLVRLNPAPMTKEFAAYLKNRISKAAR